MKAYKCPAGIWTIGYGHTVGVKEGMTISEAKAEALLKEDVQIYYDCVIRRVGDICNQSEAHGDHAKHFTLSQNQIAALTSFCYNIGIDAFCKSALLKVIKINPNNFEVIKTEFMKWVHGGGKVLPGLVKRREEEFVVYCEGS